MWPTASITRIILWQRSRARRRGTATAPICSRATGGGTSRAALRVCHTWAEGQAAPPRESGQPSKMTARGGPRAARCLAGATAGPILGLRPRRQPRSPPSAWRRVLAPGPRLRRRPTAWAPRACRRPSRRGGASEMPGRSRWGRMAALRRESKRWKGWRSRRTSGDGAFTKIRNTEIILFDRLFRPWKAPARRQPARRDREQCRPQCLRSAGPTNRPGT